MSYTSVGLLKQIKKSALNYNQNLYFHFEVAKRKQRCLNYYFLLFPPQASTGNLAIEDMDGGTFTVSNGGVFGSLYGTPIINPPQSAILGMHGIFDRPVAINGKVRISFLPSVHLSLSVYLVETYNSLQISLMEFWRS